MFFLFFFVFFFQAEDGIRDLVRSRGLGDVYKRQPGHECEIGSDFFSGIPHFHKAQIQVYFVMPVVRINKARTAMVLRIAKIIAVVCF